MALSWISAFKAIPWGDVLAATPSIVQGAERLWGRFARQDTAAGADGGEISSPEERLQMLEAQVLELRQEAESSSRLIKSLAEQNLALVRVVDELRRQSRRQTWAGYALGVATLAAFVIALAAL